MLRFYDYDLKQVTEPGEFDIFIGGSSQATKTARLTLNNKNETLYFSTLLQWSSITVLLQNQYTSTDKSVEVMTFNIRLDAPSDSANNWKYRKENVYQMITYYHPDLLGMQEVCHNQMEDLKQGLPQYTALGVGRDDGKEAGEYCPIFFNPNRFTLLKTVISHSANILIL